MKITKIAGLLSKKQHKPELENVFVSKDKIVATNSFALIEYDNALTKPDDFEIKEGVYNASLFAKEINAIGTKTVVYRDGTRADFEPIADFSFPEYKPLMPSMSDRYTADIDVSIEYLRAMLDAFKEQKAEYVTIKVNRLLGRPLVLETNKGVRGIIMLRNK